MLCQASFTAWQESSTEGLNPMDLSRAKIGPLKEKLVKVLGSEGARRLASMYFPIVAHA